MNGLNRGSGKHRAVFPASWVVLACTMGCFCGAVNEAPGQTLSLNPLSLFSSNGSGKSPASWPVDAAIIPPPNIFLAKDDNCLANADVPDSPAGDVVAVEGNKFTVTVPQAKRFCAYQDCDTDCWAACTQALLGQIGISIDQDALANEFVPPDSDDKTGSVGVIIRALNPDLDAKVEQRGTIPIDLVAVTSDQMIQELLAGHLCIVGMEQGEGDPVGHACVVCGATFAKLKPSLLGSVLAVNSSVPQNGNALQSSLSPVYGLYEVQIFDPYKDKLGGLRVRTAQQFCNEAVFLTSHAIARDLLVQALAPPPNAPPGPGQLTVKSQTEIKKERAIAKAKKEIKNAPPAEPVKASTKKKPDKTTADQSAN